MDSLDFLSNVLKDYCTLHNLEYISADDLLYQSNNELTPNQQDWLSCYITVWDIIQEVN